MDPIDKKEVDEKVDDSLLPAAGVIIWSIEWKMLVLLFLIFILISSDVFISRILSKGDNAVVMGRPTTSGTVIQGMTLVGLFAGADMLVKNRIL